MDVNSISSHILFNLKTEYNGDLRLKSRIAAHGNLDAEKDHVRAYCATVDMFPVRLIIFLVTCLCLKFGSAYIKESFT